ncbi:MAG: hypothetical protein K4305_01595, partial [Chlorobium sp.]|uniref:hypothetical protein n=1 Tax=Chlorobium sp. TaxID=1095 RepID=UPI002F40AC04
MKRKNAVPADWERISRIEDYGRWAVGRKHEVIDEEEVANGLESGDRSYDVEACGWKRKIIAHGLA